MPFHNRNALEEVLENIKELKPEIVIQMGDLFDQYCFSRFTKKNIIRPEAELDQARNFGFKMWHQIKTSNPESKCIQLLGNHDLRLIKRAEERLPEAQELIRNTVLELYRFPEVLTIEDHREEYRIGEILFMHGFRAKLGDHMRYNLENTVCGHSHIGGVIFELRGDKILWELNCGHLADHTKEPLCYSEQKISKWTLGYGLITIDNIARPQFVPLE